MDYKPRLIFWELTNRCNLQCRHCRAEAKPEPAPGELTTEEAFIFIDSLLPHYNPILVLTGGEPLYRKDVLGIARYASEKGLTVALATNGTLIDKPLAQKIQESGIRRVSISLDGATAETHDRFRGQRGAFDQALAGFHALKKIGMSLQINTTVTRQNLAELPNLLKLVEGLRADAFHIFLLVPVGCGMKIAADEEITPQQYEEVLDWYYYRSRETKLEFKATCAPHYYRILRQKAREEGQVIPTAKEGMAAVTRGCLAGSGVCFLSYRGDIQGCGYLPISAGNLRAETFANIWNHSELFQKLRRPELLKGKCGICEYRVICEGCRARAYGTTGDFLDEEPFCVYEPLKKEKVAVGLRG